ncbi:response regulator transcription factor RpaB [Thermosynechococcus sp.]|uniref:response regulator transcription factor RpaB n=1 Tax=Thermosynechococcus sp. TaxID=2814275 RepID=UPI00391D7A68
MSVTLESQKDKKEKILVVDDEASIRRILETRLSMIGYTVVTAADGEEALTVFRQEQPDLVVLDVMMPKLDGYGVCQELRKESDVPIIMLTALGDVADRITGLELGADDYVVKPFSPKELEARIRSVLRRIEKTSTSGIPSSGVIQVGNIRIDTNKRQVYKGDERIRLTGMEFMLLELLVGRSGEPFSRGEILEQVWGYTPERHVDTRVVDVHISRLRAKLEEDPSNPELILTARGTGYLFQRITEPGEASNKNS